MRVALAVPFLSALLFAQGDAPDPTEPTYGHSRHGGAFDEGPRTAAYLLPGLNGRVHFPVEGLGGEAQRFFDQGLCQQHGFWHFEAERSFREVARMHPDCAMAYWGMARANDENAERAAGFICAAVQRSADAPKREQMWIDAWARYYRVEDEDREQLRSGDAARVAKATEAVVARNQERNEKDLDKLDRQLLKDVGTIVYEYPDDIEAKALLAIQNWLAYRWGSGVQIVSHTAVDALLDQVFDAVPDHPAHHYRIHLWDREDARRALRSAAAIGASAPAIAHQWHMAGHIYAKLHRHAEAAWQQEASSRCDHAHMMRDGVMPFLIHNYGHNQEWLARSLAHCGRVDDALAIAKNMAALPRHPQHNRLDEGGSIAHYAQRRLVQICEDHELWQQALELIDGGYLVASGDVGAEARRLRLKGRALYRLGRLDDGDAVAARVAGLLKRARTERADAIDAAEDEAFAGKAKRKAMFDAIADAGREATSDVQAVLDLRRELAGERLLAQGDAKAALAEFEAVKGLSKLLLADVRVAAGERQKAIEVLEKLDEKSPGRAANKRALLRAYTVDGQVAEQFKHKARDVLVWTIENVPTGYAEQCMEIGIDVCRRFELETPVVETAGFGADFGERPALHTLGPRTWSPVANPGFRLAGTGVGFPVVGLKADGARIDEHMCVSETAEGRATLVVFYLGFGCLHCVEQLHALRPMHQRFRAIGVDVVAIGTDTVEGTHAAHADLPPAERLPFPLLVDPKLDAFKAWHCFDDFEQMALHGVFLVDADGKVRWQDISYEPFMELEWLLDESQRLLALPNKSAER